MRALGFQIVRCGVNGPKAWALAEEWNRRWQALRKRKEPPAVNIDNLSRDQAEATRRYPPGSVGAAFQIYIRTPDWASRAHLTREKIWWPARFRIRDMWGMWRRIRSLSK
jgi:phosphatidylserine/phosphatidylglycerophosphate/cardiolipin synthase-like enzyme